MKKAIDSIQQQLTSYACELNYDGLSPEAIHAAKVRIIDTLGALFGGFFAEPCTIARNLAAQAPHAAGSTIIGTRMKTTPDMAAFVNGTTARHVEFNDIYMCPGAANGHPSDVITPVLGVGEHAHVSGRQFITGVVLAYEVYQRICDVFHNLEGFDHTNFCCLGVAAGAGKILELSPSQFSHCIAMAVVPNNILRQARLDHTTMFKAAVTGHAARSGVFAALLARAGMEGPHLPFEGKAGWCEHIARERFSLGPFGGNGTPFKIPETQIKPRPAAAQTIPAILAAEKVAPVRNIEDVHEITVEVHRWAKERVGTGERRWNPTSREVADHSIPFNVAAALMDGTVTPRSYNDAHLWDPKLRALMQKISVVENEEFTKAYEQVPKVHRARVTVVTNGERLIGEAGVDKDDLGVAKSDTQIAQKFRGLTEDLLGAKRVDTVLDRLWHLEELCSIVEVPQGLTLD